MIYKIFPASRIVSRLLIFSLLTYPIFAQDKTVELNKIFTLNSGETAEIEGGKLKIRLLGVGRTIAESGEIEYAELQVTMRGAKRKINFSERGNKSKRIGVYTISLVNADSFGKANCSLKISRKNENNSRAGHHISR